MAKLTCYITKTFTYFNNEYPCECIWPGTTFYNDISQRQVHFNSEEERTSWIDSLLGYEPLKC